MWKVYVGNLHSRIREMELADEFRAFGVVRSVWVARNPPGYAFVEFDNRQEADDAISALDGKHGWRVEMSRKSVGGRIHGSSSSGTRCSDCGSSRHRSRDCRSRGSRDSYKRSPSPRSRTGSHGHSPLRKRGRSRSPVSENQCRDSSLRKACDGSGSQKSDQSRSPRHEEDRPHDPNGSQKSDNSRSPIHEQNSLHEDGSSPMKEEYSELGRSP